MAGHAEYARPAGAGLHAAVAGDLFVSVPRAVLGSLVLWAVLCRRSGFLDPWFPAFPSLSRVPPWRLSRWFPARWFGPRWFRPRWFRPRWFWPRWLSWRPQVNVWRVSSV